MSESPETAWAEFFRAAAEQGLPPHLKMPRDLMRLEVDVSEIADLSTGEALEAAGLSWPEPASRHWPSFPMSAFGLPVRRNRQVRIKRFSKGRHFILLRRIVLLLCLAATGVLAVASSASATTPTDKIAGVEAAISGDASNQVVDRDRSVSKQVTDRVESRIGKPGTPPDGIHASSATAIVSAPNFARQRKKCRKFRASKRQKCLKQVTKSQQRWKRQHRVKKMTFPVAKAQALDVARFVYLDSEFSWSGYDAGACKRLSRVSVQCVYMVWEDIYSDTGEFLDTIICGDHIISSYDRRNRLKVTAAGNTVCLWDSEI